MKRPCLLICPHIAPTGLIQLEMLLPWYKGYKKSLTVEHKQNLIHLHCIWDGGQGSKGRYLKSSAHKTNS